jgi:glucose/arabinose dehydrogenase
VAASGNGEYGLLGLAFHPDFPEDPRIFLNYTIDSAGGDPPGSFGRTRVASYEVRSDDPDSVDLATEQVLYEMVQPQGNHNGGMLAFGPDGCLFVGTGDGGNSNDMGSGHSSQGNGQDLDNGLGKILRIDQDDPENAPPGNMSGAGEPMIWDYGIRNAWRFSFDRETGDLYIGDVGQGAREEIDVSPKGVGNVNWGWPILEGTACGPIGDCDTDGLEPPVHEYGRSGGDCVIGGYVYRGSEIPSLVGWYIYGDNGPGRHIRALTWDGTSSCDDPLLLHDRDGLDLPSDISSFGEDAQGELYVTTIGGGVYRFEAAD